MTVSEQLIYFCHMSLKLHYYNEKKYISSEQLWNKTGKLYNQYLNQAEKEIKENPEKYKNELSKYGFNKFSHILGIKQIKIDYNIK